jgi:hypothetical protein
MRVTVWSEGDVDPAAHTGDCHRCGEPLPKDRKTMKVEGRRALIRMRDVEQAMWLGVTRLALERGSG